MDELGPILFILAIAVFWAGATLGARRFARRRKLDGKWDDTGPIDPSLPPPDFLQGYPEPWGVHRPVIESEDDENLFRYPIEREHDRGELDDPPHEDRRSE